MQISKINSPICYDLPQTLCSGKLFHQRRPQGLELFKEHGLPGAIPKSNPVRIFLAVPGLDATFSPPLNRRLTFY
jgi:hypothetical protein